MLDLSHELLLVPYKRGIMLKNPKFTDSQNQQASISNVLKFPFNVYFLDHMSTHRALNESEAEIMGFGSIQETIGKSSPDVSDKSGKLIRENDEAVLKMGHSIIIEENLHRNDQKNFQTLSFKFPIYNNEDKIHGIFGCSIILGHHALADSLTRISQLGLLLPMSTLLNQKSEIPILTQRQIDCLVPLIQGKTMKQIARSLHLSPKTIEHYLQTLKVKLDCGSRSQLIYKASQIQAIKNRL